MEAERDQLQARRTEADRQFERARSLFRKGLLSRGDLEAAETKSAALAFDLSAARERMNAALIEHNRRQASIETAVSVAGSNLSAGRAQVSNLALQLDGARRLRGSIEDRLRVLEQKRAQFDLIAPLAGTLFGEELPRALGQHFLQGGEICRVADTSELLVRVLVPEQEVGDIAAAQSVRVKTRAFPDRIFHGAVSRIGGGSEVDSNGQRSYRVELTIQNQDGLLRPGMTVFARIDFGRHALAWVAAHKVKQILRPELWML
jgi:HlyD family secretion protein